MKQIIYGLDFGTSNSAIAILNNSGESEVLKIGNAGSKKTIRSVLFFPTNKKKTVYVGDTAVKEYVNSGMEGRFLQSIKSILRSRLFKGTNVTDFGFLGPDDLVALMLKYMKKNADEIIGNDVKRVVLGRPAKFSDDPEIDKLAQNRLLSAAKIAGFNEIHFQLEPIAAALHYESKLKKEKLVLVADIGGGTSDFTIMKLSPLRMKDADRQKDILSSNGVYVGGDNFDSAIMRNKLLKYFGQGSNQISLNKILPIPNHILSNICRWQDIGFMKNRAMQNMIQKILYESDNREAIMRLQALINEDLGFSLFCEIEKAKISLSSELNSRINFKKSIIEIEELISRAELETYIASHLNEIEDSINESMLMASVSIQRIDAVFMTGGSSLIPSLRNLLIAKFGNKIAESDSFTSVVSGLALSTGLL